MIKQATITYGSLSLLLSSPLIASSPVPTPENQVTPESETAVAPAKPLVKKIAEDRYQIGDISFNKKTREITLNSQTNIIDPGTPLEFLLVHSNGEKVHESLLVTEVDPTNLNIALKLLNYPESQELFRQLKADNTLEENYPIVADKTRKAARISIQISWKEGDQLKSAPITQWLRHRVTTKAMTADTAWVYNGSYVHNGKFKAKLTGNIFAIFPNESALANYPGADREDDTLWVPAPKLPREGTKVTVTIKPWAGKLLPQNTQNPS